MGYKTLDGFELQEGEECYVIFQCAVGEHRLSTNPRKAHYMDETAKQQGWDFTSVKPVRTECDSIEVTAVWKNNPHYSGPKEWD